MNLTQFRKWLDLNPYVRTVIVQAINPRMWLIDEERLPKAIDNTPYELSDKTKIGNSTWAKLKQDAMSEDIEQKGWIVSTLL